MRRLPSITTTTRTSAGRLATVGLALATAGAAVALEPTSDFERPVYSVRRVEAPIAIDGRLDEPAWLAAPSIKSFHFPWYKSGTREQTLVKALWDDQFLYLAHVCQDAHITAKHANHDDPVPEDDCFEIMIVPDPQRPNYYNLEWNLNGAYVDGRRPDGPAAPRSEWDVEGFRRAGACVGTPNDDSDRDSYWICEVAIPLGNFADVMPHSPPRPGDQWLVNFNRHGGDVNLQYSQWSPVDSPTPAFHAPHRFGRLVFSGKTSPFDRAGGLGAKIDEKASKDDESQP